MINNFIASYLQLENYCTLEAEVTGGLIVDFNSLKHLVVKGTDYLFSKRSF